MSTVKYFYDKRIMERNDFATNVLKISYKYQITWLIWLELRPNAKIQR